MLNGKTIILGVTGGIAVYKAVELLRLYVKAGADVHVVMTKNAQQFVTPLTFQTLSGNSVHTDLFNLAQEQEIGHISLADRADLFVVAPATANFIGKVAHGLADDLLSTSVMATKAPVLLVPAMNVNMFENPIYQRNQDQLRADGYRMMDPVVGALACGWEGKGKMPDPSDIFDETAQFLVPGDFCGTRILITAGPTRENIDPVRYISNYSSGKMGYAVARQARRRGAQVTLISGPVQLTPPEGVRLVKVSSADEMYRAVMQHASESDVIVKAAAVADFRAAHCAQHKMKKGQSDELTLTLTKNRDILAELGQIKDAQILVGFAAETEDLVANAALKLRNKNLDMIVANDVTDPGAGFDVDTNVVKFLYADGSIDSLSQRSKDAVADELLDRIVSLRKGD
ncbi:MAG: bifunctional phosphopantothenoylcysteine decarboxylase/phosphopantothenate--cysteine ligase CoaBC [Desulfuromonas sp.]|nr:MAG: bifunctional phosphopantothenoylcysteine decarboxylase/phosphopantothenate--cysteine ligase CoaBC [Desulfuromonas sp.]